MTDYFKALRPDGTDFATGKTRPKLGKWLPRIDGELVMCERGYHVADAPGETLIGGSWPCKLARVEIPDGAWEQQDHKHVVPTYRVVEWLPSWMALGPNGEEVAAFIERVPVVLANPAAQEAARGIALEAKRWGTRDTAWEAAERAARYAAADAAWLAAWRAARGAARLAARRAAKDAARWAAEDAAVALVVRDLITPEDFDMPYAPWAAIEAAAATP